MTFVDRLAAALRAEGVHVETMLVRTLFRPWVFFPQLLQIVGTARRGRLDILHAQYGTYTGLITGLAAALSRRTSIVTFRGSDLNPVPSEHPIKLRIQHLFSQLDALLADAVVCVSGHLASRLWWAKRRLAIIPSSTDLDRFRPLDQAECRRRLGWSDDRPVCVFFCGNNAAVKRADLANAVRSLVDERAAGVRVEIVPMITIDDVPTYLNAADCLLFLSDYEGSPNLIRDACACGLPIVTVDAGDVRSVLEGVDWCRVVERNKAAIADAVIDVAKRRVRSNGRATAMRYANQATAHRMIAFYTSIVRGTDA
jgi:glycosyltransferase involved in cell wall biosynthesis